MRSRKTLIILSLVAFVFFAIFGVAFGLQQAEKVIASHARQTFATFAPAIEVRFEQAKINPFTRMVMLKGVEVRSSSFDQVLKIRAIGAGKIDWASIVEMVKTRKPAVPAHVFLAVSGLAIPARWAGETASQTLIGLGYETLEISTTVDLTIDMKTKSFAISPLAVDVKNAGRFEFSIDLANATLPTKSDFELLKKNPKAFVIERLPAYGDISLSSIALRYEDDSFIPKAIDFLIAQGEDHPVGLLNLALENPAQGRKTAAAQATSFSRHGLEALRDFLQKPGSIGISSALPKPIPFTSLLDEKTGGSIDELAAKLALQIERN